MTTVREGYITLGYRQAALCAENPEAYIRTLVNYGSQRSVLMTVYNALVQDGRLPRIEDLPEQTKREWWEQAKTDAAGRLPADKLKVLARCLYVLDFLLQTS
jgi:hypothetical protein